jgi:hypothetical protein
MAKIQSDKLQWELLIKDSEAQKNIANLSKANKDLEKSNKEIRLEMARLEAQGKKNSDEWKGLQDVMKKNSSEIANNTQLIKANENQLGTQSMTMNQLKKRYQELLKEMNNTSKATDPKAWESLKAQLDETRGAMSNLAGGTQKAEGVMISWGSAMKIGLMGALVSLGQKVLSVLGDIFSLEKIIDSTQSTGDKFRATMAGLENAFSQLRLSIATMDFSNFTENLREAYRVAAEVTAQLDELFERQNSFKIQDIKVQSEIEDLYEVMNNVNKSDLERQAAGEKIRELTKSQAELQTEIYAQEANGYAKMIKNRTQLNDQQLEFYIDEYNRNRDVIKQAEELISLENEVNRVKNIGSSQSAAGDARALQAKKEYDQAKKNLDLYLATNAAQIDGIKQVAQIARGYDRANDEFIQKYVESRTKMMSVDVEASKSLRRVERTINTMTKSITDEAIRQRKELTQKSKQEQEKMYKDEIDIVESAQKQKIAGIKEMFIAGHLSQQQYNSSVDALEQELIEKKMYVNIKYSKSIDDLQNELLNKQIVRIQKYQAELEKLKKAADAAVQKDMDAGNKTASDQIDNDITAGFDFMQKAAAIASKLIESQKDRLKVQKELYDQELAALKESLDQQMLTREQYEEGVKDLELRNWKERFKTNSEKAGEVIGIIQEGLAFASQVISQLKDVELTRLEGQKQRELAIHGDTFEKRAEIEQKYEETKLKIQQKYADIDMGIKISQTLAAGALAAIQALGQLGPIAGAVAIAAISAMTAVQVGMIVAQRNAIKSGSGGGSVSSSGGYGERMVLGSSQQQTSSSAQVPTSQVPAAGVQINSVNTLKGESFEKQSSAITSQVDVMKEVSGLLRDLKEKPIAAYTVLSQQEKRKDQFNRIREEGSL